MVLLYENFLALRALGVLPKVCPSLPLRCLHMNPKIMLVKSYDSILCLRQKATCGSDNERAHINPSSNRIDQLVRLWDDIHGKFCKRIQGNHQKSSQSKGSINLSQFLWSGKDKHVYALGLVMPII